MLISPLDFNIIWVESCAYPAKSGISRHDHTFFHYILVVSGEGEITIGNQKQFMRPNHIYLTPPFTAHDFSNTGTEPLRSLEIKFSLEDAKAVNRLKKLPFYMSTETYPIVRILSTIYKEQRQKAAGYSDIISCEFQVLLTTLLRCSEMHAADLNQNIGGHSVDRAIEHVKDFVKENLAGDICLKQLADVAQFEKNYFVRKFKEQTGKTPMIYVRDKRIQQAMQLLTYSDMNITQIANATGFKTVHYFSKTFFDCTGQRPLDYRKELFITHRIVHPTKTEL